MRDLIDEKDGAIQVLQDELATTQLEATKLDETVRELKLGNETLAARFQQLETENAELLEWRKKATEEADRMKALMEATEEDHRYSHPLLSPALTPSIGRAFSFPAAAPPPVVTPTHASAPSSSSSYTHCSYDSESPTRGNWRGSWTSVSVIPLKSNKKMIAHESEINTMAISTNGSMFATGSNDKTVKVWDVLTRSLKSTLHGCLQSVMCVAFNSTDEYILAGSNDNAARLWHLATGRAKHTLTGHTGKVFAARFNPDSNKVVTGSHDRSIKIWDVHRGYYGFQVLTNSRDNTLRILDVRTYKTQVVLQAEGYKTGTNWSRACFSPDDQYVLAGSADGKLFYWSATDGVLEKTAQDQKSPIVGVAWSHGTAVSAEKDRTVVVWNAIARRSVVYVK
ncbi:hypothetical protein BGZ92_009329 [Podila epicladia]|nr:hypothetical protein BGZ92_009329 [Podila epicladia]